MFSFGKRGKIKKDKENAVCASKGENRIETRKRRLRHLVLSALSAAFLALVCPLTLPLGPVGFTLAVFALFLVASVWPLDVVLTATALYLTLGALGLSVFSGFEGGFQKLVGVTGGFLWAYLPSAAAVSLFIRAGKGRKGAFFAGMLLGLVLLYLGGSLWYALWVPCDWKSALAVTVLPFLLPDLIKIIAASAVGYVIRGRLAAV